MDNQNPFALPIEKLRAEIQKKTPVLLVNMGAIAIDFAIENFQKQGWQGDTFVPWEARKSKDKKDIGRQILVKTGHLRNATKYTVLTDAVRISNNMPYAAIHNNGGTINHPGGGRVLAFNKKGKFTKQNTPAQLSKVNRIALADIGAHNISMPQREFIGYSPVLTHRIVNMIKTELLK